MKTYQLSDNRSVFCGGEEAARAANCDHQTERLVVDGCGTTYNPLQSTPNLSATMHSVTLGL